MPYLMGLTSQFTTYSLYDCVKINSIRSIRLYESLCQHRSSGVWIATQDWLSERFVLPESQRSNFAEMKRTFINPALKKINAHMSSAHFGSATRITHPCNGFPCGGYRPDPVCEINL